MSLYHSLNKKRLITYSPWYPILNFEKISISGSWRRFCKNFPNHSLY